MLPVFQMVVEYVFGIFSDWMVLVLVLCGFWSFSMVSRGLAERKLGREADLAFYGGWFYLGLGLIAFAGGRLYNFFF
ncbi:MAG TPA: hypothetical protein GX711_06395 [Clostridia bacterium]|jgi:hypothetical protein|nr:hypothetical protein [Clostridia bacterium]